jgi:acyl-CoA thioesterase-2
MTQPLDGVVALLDLEPIEVNIFRGRSPDETRQRVFGGQVAAQALVAAVRTVDVPGRAVHSLHAYFLRPGDPRVPILYEVDRIRDGRSFTTRRVTAIQHGKAIFNLSASFHTPEEGFVHATPMPDVPDPEDLPTTRSLLEPTGIDPGLTFIGTQIDLRWVTPLPTDRDRPLPPRQLVWFRANGVFDDDPVLHRCLLTYASDLTLLDTTLLPHGVGWQDHGVEMASLDHAIWFHGDFRADEWLLYEQDTPAAAQGRGLARGLVYRRDGTLVATVIQEGLLRTAAGSAR